MQISCTSKNLDIHHNRVYHRHMAQGRQTVFWCEFGLQIKRIEFRCLRYNLEESRVNTFGLAQQKYTPAGVDPLPSCPLYRFDFHNECANRAQAATEPLLQSI
jgi:hypothetical protein